MGILDKLLGTIKAAAEKAKQEIENAANALENAPNGAQADAQNAELQAEAVYVPEDSYWTRVPEEYNQYNSGLSYREYFERIFRENFSGYALTVEEAKNRPATVFTFMNGAQKVLVVELMSEKSSAQMLRWRCKNEGVPYLRFYYDHFGWWNCKSYVIERTEKALNLA